MGVVWNNAEFPEGSDRRRANPGRRSPWTHWLVKPGDVLLAGYTIMQCALLLALAGWANRSTLSSCG